MTKSTNNERIDPTTEHSGAFTYFRSLVWEFEDAHYMPIIEASLRFSDTLSQISLAEVAALLKNASDKLTAIVRFIAATADSKDFALRDGEAETLKALLNDQLEWLNSEASIIDDQVYHQFDLARLVAEEEGIKEVDEFA